MAVSLLKYANREAVAQALTEQGYSVTRQTVNRWARGDEMPSIAAQMIASLFGHGPGQVDVRQLDRIEGLVRAIGARVGLSADEIEEAVELHAAVTAERRSAQHSGGGPEPAGLRLRGT